MSSILTVSQLNRYIRFRFQSDVKLRGIAVKGELSNFSVHYKSGHAYFSVKDENSAVKCVMFSSSASKLRFTPQNGMNVLVVGNIEVYERDGIYQMIASEIQPMGVGAVQVSLEQLKNKLSEKGVFDASAKKKIPLIPKKLAIVTSLTGAALQDILNVLERRFPIVRAEIYPAQVQGSYAPDSIAQALKKADSSGADTIILARGGGSDEDLMPFNSEKTVLAVYDCVTPVISAVGHEIDTTLTDYAADLRAPTPSAAAELAVPVMSELISAADLMKQRIDIAMLSLVERELQKQSELRHRLKSCSPREKIENDISRLDNISKRLEIAVRSRLDSDSLKLDRQVSQLFALSPFNILTRGYTITLKNGSPVSSASGLVQEDKITIRFADGSAEADVTQVTENDL